jgi:transglutaminase-like putative cysteine protease
MKRATALVVLMLLGCGPTGPARPMDGKACCKAAADAPEVCCKDGGRRQVVSRDFLKTGDARSFEIEYAGKVTEIPPGTKRLRVWIPVPQNTTVQEIRGLSFSREPRIGVEEKYGNRMAFWEFEGPGTSFEVSMKFACTRLEIRTDLELLRGDGQDPDGSFSVFRKADRLVPVDGEVKRLSDEICRGKRGALEKGRAIYDHVVARMSYDKNHAGWGTGSTEHACKVGKGNCTDFHALFNSLCRAQGIASGFEIGLYLPYDRKSTEQPGGYHCWAFFRVPGKTWVPVDCSEASRFGDKREFFFGGHTSNRVTLSTGRDLVLAPPQAGEPLNYFLNPYAEADGKPVKTDKSWSYRNMD